MQTQDAEHERALDRLFELISRLIARAHLIQSEQDTSSGEETANINRETR